MGTRNLICIWYKGRFMVAQYCQWDGYLEGQGAKILEFLLVPGNIERLKKGLTRITPIDDETLHDILGKHSYSTFKNNKKVCECGAAVRFQETEQCFPPALNRDTGAKIFDIIAAARPDDYIPVHMQLGFATNGLFCEYCYCVDLDADVFEIFGGAAAIPNNTGDEILEQIGRNRFAEVCKAEEAAPLLGKSMPRLLKSWPLAQLPTDLDDMLNQVAAENAGESEYEDGQNDDLEDYVDDDTEGSVKDGDDKKAGYDDKPADYGKEKKSQEDRVKKSDDQKKAAVADDDKKTIDDEAQKPVDKDNKTVVAEETDKTVDDVKTQAERDGEFERRINQITEDLLIEAAQLEIKRERERAAMQQAATAGDKDRTFTLSIRETK